MPTYNPPALVVTLKFDVMALFHALNPNPNPLQHPLPDPLTMSHWIWGEMNYFTAAFLSAIRVRTPVSSGWLQGSWRLRPVVCKVEGMVHWVGGEDPVYDIRPGPSPGTVEQVIYAYLHTEGNVSKYVTLTSAVDTGQNPTNPRSYAMSVELGSAPHVPPLVFSDEIYAPNLLVPWAYSHMGDPNAAWALQRHIAKHGKPVGVAMVAKVVTQDLPAITSAAPLFGAVGSGDFVVPESKFATEYTSGSYEGRIIHEYEEIGLEVIDLTTHWRYL